MVGSFSDNTISRDERVKIVTMRIRSKEFLRNWLPVNGQTIARDNGGTCTLYMYMYSLCLGSE